MVKRKYRHFTYIKPFFRTILDVLQSSQEVAEEGRHTSKMAIATSSKAGPARAIVNGNLIYGEV